MLIQIVRTHTHPHTQWTSSTSHRHLKRITQKFRIRNGRRVERRSTKFVPFQNNKTFHRAHWVKNRFCQHSKTNVIRFQIVSCQVREQKGDGEKKNMNNSVEKQIKIRRPPRSPFLLCGKIANISSTEGWRKLIYNRIARWWKGITFFLL